MWTLGGEPSNTPKESGTGEVFLMFKFKTIIVLL
jgi:hypothetical protein